MISVVDRFHYNGSRHNKLYVKLLMLNSSIELLNFHVDFQYSSLCWIFCMLNFYEDFLEIVSTFYTKLFEHFHLVGVYLLVNVDHISLCWNFMLHLQVKLTMLNFYFAVTRILTLNLVGSTGFHNVMMDPSLHVELVILKFHV